MSYDEDDLFTEEELLDPDELARMERRERDYRASERSLMNNGAAKVFKAITEAPSYKGVPKAAKGKAPKGRGKKR
jgi:hypothetical protein